jgi:hypothetical protein
MALKNEIGYQLHLKLCGPNLPRLISLIPPDNVGS